MIVQFFLKSLFDDMVAFTALAFIIVIFMAFVKFIISGDTSDRSLQKLIGGLSVFIVAIISKNSWVFSLSIFVGGLIIASEDFMKFLAAIMKSASDKIPETVNALYMKASHAAVKEKVKEETIEAVATTAMQKNDGEKDLQNLQSRMQRVRKIEGLVHNYMSKVFGKDYESQMQFSGPQGKYIFDGIIKAEHSVKYVVEVKYLTSLKFEALNFSIQRFLEKIKKLSVNLPAIVVVIADQIDAGHAMDINRSLKDKFDVRLLFFKYENDNLAPLLIPPFFHEYNSPGVGA